MDLTIRIITKEEQPPYSLLLLADPSHEMVNDYLKTSDVYVAEKNNNIIGVCVLYPINSVKAEIKNIAVEPHYQQQGIGNAMMYKVMQEAKVVGYKELIIGTGNCGFSQLYMYQRLGFEMTEIKKNFFVDNYKEPIFENGIQCKHMVILTKTLE